MIIKAFVAVFVLGAAALAVVFFSVVPVSRETEEPEGAETIGLAEEELPVGAILPRLELPPVAPSSPAAVEPKAAMQTEIQVKEQALEDLPKAPALPPLREQEILRAVVKIQCPTADGLGKYTGSGFVLAGGTVVTAAHVLKDSGSPNCEVIFPRERRPVHYLRGTTEDLEKIRQRHDEEGIDVAFLKLPELASYPEARAIFEQYPEIPYPVCGHPKMIGDQLLHFGYPSNYADQTYLSRQEGVAVVYADINGIREQLSSDQTYAFKSPIFAYTYDETQMHPYMVSRVASFYGDSGGLAFNASRQCLIGPHRGGTIGKASGENFSVFMNLGWEKVRQLLP